MDRTADELTEAFEREAATREILRVINRSPDDYEPVFEAILDNATRLCEAPLALLMIREADGFYLVAQRGARSEFVEYYRSHPVANDPQRSIAVRSAAERRPIQLLDIADETVYQTRHEHARLAIEVEGVRTLLIVPLVRDNDGIGVIVVYRREVRAFEERHVSLLSDFAEMAVIALENVRRFKALNASLDRQTATSEILRVISSSPTDYAPVFDTILGNAIRLCGAPFGILFLLRDGHMQLVADAGSRPEYVHYLRHNPIPLDATDVISSRVARARVPLQIADITRETLDSGASRRLAAVELGGVRTLLYVPLLKGDNTVGLIALYRQEVKLFAEDDIELVTTFADQAVIAIENVRLFQAIEARTAELTNSLERQTATSEILRAISRSPTDYLPVFETILENAIRLCGTRFADLFLRRDDYLHFVAERNGSPEHSEFMRAHPVPVQTGRGVTATAARNRTPTQHADIVDDAYRSGDPFRVHNVDVLGIRTMLGVPMLKGEEVIGVITLYRQEVRPFTDDEIALVSTFADQAVIAIENVRLFQTVESRSRELAQSVAELEALGEVAQAVSSSLDLYTVLNTIIERAVELSGAHAGAINELDEATGTLPPRAAPNVEELLELPAPRLGEGAVGRAAATRAPVQIPDITVPGAYTGVLLDALAHLQIRALLAVPMVQEDRVLGTLVVARRTPGEFPPETVRVLQALGTQSAIAIRNARLFREIEDKRRELEAANRHKSEFLANMSHELRTPLNAVIGFSEVLGERMFGDLNDKQAEYVNDIHDSGRHLLSLINDILDLSKIEAGAMELDVSRFALVPALDNAVSLVKERAGRRGISLQERLEEGLGEIEGDERKLKQILLNLLSNAIKFTAEGGTVTLEASRDDGAVTIAVRDTGVGISEEDQAVIFEEFRQVGADYARKVEGTGLGLTLTKRFVEMHGGTISVESEPGAGSTFHVRLPLRPAEAAA